MLVVFRKHIPAFESHSIPIAEGYTVSNDLNDYDLCTMGILIYDSTGNCVASRLPLNFESENDANAVFGPAMEKTVFNVLQGKIVQRLGIVTSERAFYMSYGRSIIQNGQTVGALFLIRYLPDLYGILTGITVSITAIFFSLTLCTLYAQHKKRKFSQMENDYIANITHDLKSPITSIKALSENLSLGVVKDENVKKKYYTLLAKESFKLQHTVQGILELSAMQSDQTDFSKQSLKLKECFEPIIEKYRTLCDDMMIEFYVSETFSTLPRVYTNPKNIARLLEILLDNAVKFVDENGVIHLDAVSDAKSVTVCVRDNGIGIAKEDQGHIFDRFYMVNSSYNVNGSGLGLAIAQEIATNLKECIWVESELGKGSSFYFTVRLK